jgi:hypothetical protein
VVVWDRRLVVDYDCCRSIVFVVVVVVVVVVYRRRLCCRLLSMMMDLTRQIGDFNTMPVSHDLLNGQC